MLAKRYASPFLLLEEVVRQGRLSDFVNELNQAIDEEQLWQIWLYKVNALYDNRPFKEWKEAVTAGISEEQPDLKTTITNSIEILDGFTP